MPTGAQIAVQETIIGITDVLGGTNGPVVDNVGDIIHYQIQVTNPGTVALSVVTENSSLLGILSANSGDGNNNGLLDPGEIWSYTGSHTVTGSEIVWDNHH